MMKDKIIINEVGLRECFQKQEKLYSIEKKLELLDGLILSGLKHIQLCSFVSPKILPQMGDAEKFYFSAPKSNNIVYSAFILNVKGVNRAISCGINKLETSISLDDKYGLTNTGMDCKRSLNELSKIADLAHKNNIKLRIGLQCAWGRKSFKKNIINLSDKIDKIIAMDPHKICLADTAGLAKPDTIKEYLEVVIPMVKEIPLVIHLHQTETNWKENVHVAIDMGIREFDSSLGGEGGSPFLHTSKGNVPTEELAELIDQKGFYSGVDQSVIKKTALKLYRIVNNIPDDKVV